MRVFGGRLGFDEKVYSYNLLVYSYKEAVLSRVVSHYSAFSRGCLAVACYNRPDQIHGGVRWIGHGVDSKAGKVIHSSQFGTVDVRSVHEFLDHVGIDMKAETCSFIEWCNECGLP